MLNLRILPALAHFYLASQFAHANEAIGRDEQHAEALIVWLKSKRGYFNPGLEMRRVDPAEPNSRFGMFAREDMEAQTLMIQIPTSIILSSREEDPEMSAMECGTVRNLVENLRLKDESDYAPYVNYLLDTQPPGQLPSAWSEAGKALFKRVLGYGKEDQHILPPAEPVSWIEDDWYGTCKGSNNPLEEYAALLVVQRSWDDLLIPVNDMMSHRNGHWLNTQSSNVHEGDDVRISASRDIKAGEEIYTTYNFCEDCANRFTTYGTPEILRDYGFVEQFPQSWIFSDIDVAFRVDQALDKEGNATGKYVLTEWIEGLPDEDAIQMLKESLEQVVNTKENALASRDQEVPENEWNTISDYMDAMIFAMGIALDASTDNNQCIEEGTCTVETLLARYADLEAREMTYTDDSGNSCDLDEQMSVFDSDGKFDLIEDFKSHYQQINYMWNPVNRDTCFDLDDTVQICDSYRPHYHEMFVHYTARFLPEIKRVLWVGGGDSMLLHEILKYPSLELAVGLELDQKVIRGAFKHFGTQPHFDDDRVEWWLGDAAKSLLMLPKDYFGSFDMVLVDLSETVMSFKVTDKLDVLEALALLVKPDGIFVKNELYFGKFKQTFPHSVQIHWYVCCALCCQIFLPSCQVSHI